MPYTQDEMDALLAKAREKDLAKGGEQGDEMDALLAKAREKDRAKGVGGTTKQPMYSWPSWLQPEDKATAALVKEGQLRDALISGDEELAQEIYSTMVVDEVKNTIGQWGKDHVKQAAQSIYELGRPKSNLPQNLTEAKIVFDNKNALKREEGRDIKQHAEELSQRKKSVEKVEDDGLRGFGVRKHAKDIVESYIKENPDKEEYRELYELYVADEIQRGIVVEQTKEERLKELKKKVDEIYNRSGWFSSLVPDWRNRTLSLITLMPWFTNEDLVGEDFAEVLNSGELDFLTGIPWLIDEATGRYQARGLSKQIDAYLDPSFGKGFVAEIDHSEVPSFGVVGLVSELDKLNVAMKVKDGDELSAREKDILELMQIEQEAKALDYEINGDEWNAADLGRSVGFSIEIISQIILGMVATGGVGTVASLSAQGGKVFVQQGVKQGAKAAVKKLAKEAVEEGIKQVTKKEAAVILAKNAGVLAGRSAIATAASPMMWHNFLDRRVGQYSFDENGEIVYTEQSWASDLFKAYTESFFEYYSEMLGAEVGALVNLSPARLGRIVGLGKWGKAGEKSMDFLADISRSYSVRTALNKVGIQGLSGEVLSEVGGDVMTNLMLMPFYDEYNMQFLSDPHYWGDVVMTSGILGSAHTAIGAATGMSNLGEVRKAIKARDLAFANISDAALADELKRISTLESTLEISEALANLNLDQSKYSDAERATAMEYITNDLIVKASYGAILENSRLERFHKLTRDTNNLAYEDSGRILTIKTKDGKMYYVKNGDIDDANSMLNCIDAKGKKVAILASEVQSSRETTIGQALTSVYDTFYKRENIGERLMEVESTLRQMKEPTREKVQAYLEENGLTIFKEGDMVTLADGTQGSVESVLDNGDYVVKITDPEGEVALIQVPALQVLQPNAEVAKAQKIMFKQKSEKALGDVSRAIENEQKAEATPQAEDTTADDAKALEEDEKELMSTFAVTEDGSPDFDSISNPKQYALLFAKEMGGKEAAHAQMQQMKANAVEEVEKLREKGKKLSKANDVVKNNKAIAELEQRISFYDEVLNNLPVKEDVVEENVADNVEEAKEAMDKAEAIAKEPRHAYKVGDVVDHNGRNAQVIEVHDGGVLVIDYSMGASVVGDTEVVGSDEVTPSTATIPVNVLEENVEEQSEGLVMNGFAKRLTPRFKKIVDALARLLKVKVVFVETLGAANGYISGTTIYLSYAKRDKGIGFLTGHEVTHRLQEVAPKAYAKFKEAAKKYRGKEWDKEVNKTTATYEEVNRRRTRKAQAVNDALKAVDEAIANGEEDVQAVKENLAKLEIGEDKEVALAAYRARMHVEDIERELGGSATLQDIKTKLEAEQASAEPLLEYTKDSIEDEVTADVAGEMSEKYFAIDKFLRGIDDSRLKRILRDIWQFIKDLFTDLGADTEAKRARECVEKLNALIAEGIKSEATQKRESKSGVRPSLVGVHNISIDKLRKAIKMGGLANPSVAVIDVDKQSHDDYGDYSLVLPKNMVDSRQGKNAGTWAGDAWTPTYPQVIKRMKDDKVYSHFHKDIEALPEAMRNRVRLDFDSFMDGRDVGSLAYWYLYEKGVNPALVAVPSRYSDEVINALSEATNGTFNLYNLAPEALAKCLDVYIKAEHNGDKAAYEAKIQERKERLMEKDEVKVPDRVRKWAQDKVSELNEYGFDYGEVLNFVRDVETDVRKRGTVDVEATIRTAKDQIKAEKLDADYDAWLENLDERYGIKEYIFNGYTNNGDRKYLPHTVENASKWMKKQGREGAVATFPSFGVFIANAIPKMTTLESIRKRKALLGKSKEEYDAFREKWENVYFELGKKLQPDAKGFDDYGYWRLIEAVGKSNPKEFIKKEYGIEMSEEDMTMFNDMVNAIRTEYPARYFETKFERPLQLSDFAAAVVPNDIPSDVESRLKDAGVEVIEYEKDNNASRAEAMQKASDMENVRFSLPVIQGLSDALKEYKVDGDIATFVEKVREVNDKVDLGHPMITSKLDAYDDDGDAEWFAEKIEELVGDYDDGYAPYTAGGVRYSISAPTFYSNAEFAVRGIKQEKATPEQWLKMIEKNGGLKAGEDKWLGLSDWLKASDKKTLTKDEVLQYIAENDIQIEEVEYAQFGSELIDEATRKLEAEMREIGIDAMREKYNGFDDLFEVYNNELVWSENMASESEYEDFIINNNIVDVNAQANAIHETRSRYTTNGLTNKREIALVVPTIEPYNAHDEVHFGDAGGGRAVAWVRFGETTDADGKRVLVIDEIQSKRHQDGREKGYSDKRVSQQELYDAQEEAFSKVIDYESALADKYGEDEWASLASEEEMAEYERLRAIDEAATNAYENYDKGIPSAPFEKNWAELAFKRMLRYAAENGYDYVAWTTGDQQADRYNIGTKIERIEKTDDYSFDVHPVNSGYLTLDFDEDWIYRDEDDRELNNKHISEIFGKDVAKRLQEMPVEEELSGDGLRIGGEGMKAFYDQMLPSFVKKYTKKWGAEVGEVAMPTLEENNTMHAVNVTDSMRESVMQGQPRFSLITPEMDADYLDAVERGDMATAQKMVMEAAKLAMPNTKVVDEDGPKVVYHGTDVDFWVFNPPYNKYSFKDFGANFFTDDKKNAMRYGTKIKPVFLDLTDPDMFDANGQTYNEFSDNLPPFDGWSEVIIQNIKDAPEGKDRRVKPANTYVVGKNINYQIKSADPVTYDDNGNVIPLSERFNPKKEDIRYSLIGEQGASALDAYEEATTRLDNLNVAREMEAQGKDALAIKQATGWERGKDGLWRYEVADYVNMFDSTGNVDYMRRHPEYKRYKELLRKRNAGMMFFKKGLTKEEQKEFDDLAIVYGNGVQPHNSHKLKDYLDSEELFAAYPQLRDINVEIKKELEDGYYGRYIPSRNTIELATRTHESMARTLFHEVQHAIQHIEGFANGGNTEIADPRKVRERKEAMKGLQRKIDMHERALERFEAELSELNDSMEKWWESHPEAMSREDFDSEMQALNEVYDEQLKKAEHEQNKLRETQKEYKKLVESSVTLDYEGYERLAGEVEARATARRVGMSEEKRRNTLTLNDEDVARKDQIILRNGLYENYAEMPTRYSISEPSYTDRMVDISDVMTVAERKAMLLENAKNMALEGVDAQKIVDETGWIELEDGWRYYGDADIVLSDAKSNMLRVQRWLESKRAVKRAHVRKLYDPLIKEQEALISDLEKGRAVKGRTSANYANAVESILDGQAVESLPIEDQILVDIALGQKLRWEDEKNGSRRGLGRELGLANAKDEKMSGVTRGAKDYVEDYVVALVERNRGYENGIDDNDVRNAVIETFRSYPSRQAALDELSARYPNAATTEAREGLLRLEYERDEALAEIDAEHKATMEDFEAEPERYMREYEDAQAWNESIDAYTQSLAKARNEIKRLEREAEKAGLTQREKDAAIAALKTQVRRLLSDGVNLYMRKREIQAIMNAVNEAQTTYAMVRAVEKAMWSIYEARMRMELTRLNNLLRLKLDPTLNNIDVSLFMRNAIEGGRLTMGQAKKLMEEYFKGVNGKGISVARYIDGDTATIMGFIAAYSDLKGMATTEGFNIDALCEELREALMGESIDHKYVTKEKQKAYSALDASVRDRMLGAVPIIRGLLEAQQLINGLQQSSEVYAVTTEIEDVKREIDALNAEIAEIENEGKVVMQGKVYKDKQKLLKDKKKQLRDLNKKVVAARIADAELYLGAMPNIVESLDQLNGTLETLVREGRIRLSEFHQKREERRRDLVNMAIEDIDRPAALGQGKIQYSAWQKIRAAKPIDWALGVLESLDHLLRVAARNAPDGEGQMWNHFSKAINGAYSRIFDAQKACYDELSAMTKSLFGTEYDRTMRKAERTTIGTYTIPHRIERVEDGKRVFEDTTAEVDLSISQALDIISMWNQPIGKETLMKQGFTEAKIEEIKTALNNNNTKWLEFQQWVVNEFLPAKRVKYNNVHREMNGVDMDYEVNYYPMRRDTQFMPTPVDITSPDFVNTPNSSVSTGAIIKRQNSLRPFDLDASFFMVLKEHLVEMERWSEMAPVTRDLNLLLSSPTVKKALESVGEGFYQKFVNAAKLATGNFQEQSGAFDELFWKVALRTWASARLALKAFTALKQVASSILFLQYAKSPSFIGRLLWYFSGGNIPLADRVYQHIAQGAHWDIKSNKDSHANITWALENSAMFRKRWASGTAGYDLFSQDMVYGEGKTRLARFVNDALKAFDKTQSLMLRAIAIVDAFTSAAGMRAVYEEEMVDLMKQGLSKSEAHDIALFRAEMAVNKTQQSSESIYLSPIQKSKGLIARSLTTFMNAPIAQGRNIAEAIRELGRNRETERREVYKQERKRWKEYYHPWYEAQEETIKKEKEQGIIETTEQEEMRRRQLYKEVDKHVDIMTEKTVGTRIKRAKTRALLALFLNAWIGPAVFNLMNIAPYMLMGDDDEEKKKMMNAYWLQTALGPLQVLPLGPQIVSAFTGYKFDVSSPLTAFSTEINNIVREVQEQGFSVDAAMLVGDFILEHGMGVDVDTLMDMYAGIESLFEDGYSREAVLMMMGAPNSQVKLLARERKEGETAQEYYTRLMRLYSILEEPKYEDYYTEDGEHLGDAPFGMKEYQMREMRSNWEYAYRLDVVNRNGKEGEYSDIVNTTDLYKENAKLLPSREKAFSKGEFRENTKIGDHVLNREEYIALYKLRQIANKREDVTEHFLGQDEQEYLKQLREEVKAKRAFNDKLSEITNK